MPRKKELEDAVKARIQAVGKRHKVRWSISRHTAELAIAAFTEAAPAPRKPRSSKSRRRKRSKRLL